MNILLRFLLLLPFIPPGWIEPYRGNPIPESITINLYRAPYGCLKLGDPHKINGYYYEDPWDSGMCWKEKYNWNPGVPTYATQFLKMPDLVIGQAWGGSSMEGCARAKAVSLTHVEDGVAVPFCSEIGNHVWIKRPYIPTIAGTGEWEGPFAVVDCAGQMDLYNVVVHRQEIVEIGVKTAIKWDMIRDFNPSTEGQRIYWDMRRWPEDVLISKIDPKYLPEDIIPIRLVEWFKERAVFYETQEEWDNDYKPLFKSINGIPSWRFESNGEWKNFE